MQAAVAGYYGIFRLPSYLTLPIEIQKKWLHVRILQQLPARSSRDTELSSDPWPPESSDIRGFNEISRYLSQYSGKAPTAIYSTT